MTSKRMPVGKLREHLATISKDLYTLPNGVGNLAIYSLDGDFIGYLEFNRLGGELVMDAGNLFGGLAPHQQRVIAERAELAERLAKLEAFIFPEVGYSSSFRDLPMDDRHRLHDQADAMQGYLEALDARIHHFKPAQVKT